MSRHSTAQGAFSDMLDQVQGQMDEKNSDVNVFFGKEKMEIRNSFVLLFYNSLLQIIDEYNLTKTEIKAILKILEYMQWGNLVRMSYAQLARDIGADASNSSKIIKRLKTANLLFEKDGNLYLNPHIIAKGKFKRKNDDDVKLLEYSADLLMKNTELTPSILTKSIKQKMESKRLRDMISNEDLTD